MLSTQKIANTAHHEITHSSITFPEALKNCRVIKSLGGGTRSVFLIEDIPTQKQYVLKFSAHQAACKIEMLWNAIYHALGVPVPSMHAYYNVPSWIKESTRLEFSDGYFLVAEYIQKPEGNNLDATIAQAKTDFLIHALLGNTDVKPDNFIADILIDAGSNLMYRGLGEARYDVSQIFSELWNLKNKDINPFGCDWFNEVNYEGMREQALQLLKKAHLIERTVREKSPLLGISSSLQDIILEKISERLDILIRYFFANDNTQANASVPANKETMGAGVLTYKNINGVPHVLLSKRAKHQWWANFGGKCDERDHDLSDTAARESYEESSKLLQYSKQELEAANSHDLITIDKTGRYFLYRMYFLEDPGINITDIHDLEHTEHIYVPISELLKSLEKPLIKEEELDTCQVMHDEKLMIIYPPLYQMLKEPFVQAYLKGLMQGKKPASLHTQSVVKENAKPTALSESKKKNIRNHIASKETIYQQQIETLLLHVTVLKELKTIFKDENQTALANQQQKIALSEKHLKLILGDQYTENNVLKNISAIFNQYNGYNRLDQKKKQQLLNTASRFIYNEQKNNDQYIFLYHGCNDVTAFLYSFYSMMYQYLHADQSDLVFRLNHKQLSRFDSMEDFICFYSSNTGNIDNTSQYFNDTCIATNSFLFGNHHSENSCSFKYLIENYSTSKIDINKILHDLLSPMNIDNTTIAELVAVFNHYFAGFGGSLYQFKIKKDELNEKVYTATTLGNIHKLNGSFELKNILQQFAACDLSKLDAATATYYKNLQARLVLTSTQSFDAEHIYWNEPSYDQKKSALIQLKEVTGKIIKQILNNKESVNAKELNSHAPLVRLHSLFCNQSNATAVKQDDAANFNEQVITAVYRNKPDELKTMLQEDSLKLASLRCDPYAKYILCTYMLKNNAFSFQDIAAALGDQWWAHYQVKTYDDLKRLLEKINDHETFCLMRDAVIHAIQSLNKWHTSIYFHNNVNAYMARLAQKLYKPNESYEHFANFLYIQSKLRLYTMYYSTESELDYALRYTLPSNADTLTNDVIRKVISGLYQSKLFNMLFGYCEEVIKTKEQIHAMYDELLGSFANASYDPYEQHFSFILEIMKRFPLPVDYQDSHGNTIYHLFANQGKIVRSLFDPLLKDNPTMFGAKNKNNVSVIEMIIDLLSNSSSDIKINVLAEILEKLIEIPSMHSLLKEIMHKQKEIHRAIFNIIVKIYSTADKIEYITSGNKDQRYSIFNQINKADLQNPVLCRTLLANFSLIKLFSFFDTADFVTILESSTKPTDIMLFLTLLKQIIEKNLYRELLVKDPFACYSDDDEEPECKDPFLITPNDSKKEGEKFKSPLSFVESDDEEKDIPEIKSEQVSALVQSLRDVQLSICVNHPADDFEVFTFSRDNNDVPSNDTNLKPRDALLNRVDGIILALAEHENIAQAQASNRSMKFARS